MNLKRSVNLINRVYRAEVTLNDPLTELEKLRVSQFGDVTIELGGDFTFGEGEEFSLDTDTKRFPRTTTFARGFQIDGDADANAKANAWALEIESRIVAALNAQVGQNPGNCPSVITAYTLPLTG